MYINRDTSPAHYEFLIEPTAPLDPSKCNEYCQALEKHLSEINPVYRECLDTGVIAHAVLYIQQQQTHQLWREFKLMKGASANQVKPVRVLDTPQKKDFFYLLTEK